MYGTNCNLLIYNSLRDAIPLTWTQKLRTITIPRAATNVNEANMININKKQIPLQKITNKLLYWTQVKKNNHQSWYK